MRWRSTQGYSFVELLIVSMILLVLASAVQPMVRVTMQRQKEIELRRVLREMRDAIDRFKDAADMGMIPATELTPNSEGYPPDLESLVERGLGGERRVRTETQAAETGACRSHDRQGRVGLSFLSGSARRHIVGTAECL